MFGINNSQTRTNRLVRYALLLAAAWTMAAATSLAWNLIQQRQETLEVARSQARTAYEKDVLYHRWSAGHGGVYVPVTEETQPNPYLSHVPERDVTTPSGRRLTLMSLAYMTRQINELGEEQYSIHSHITSLNPIRPENAADPWETESLRAFERGETEVMSIEEIEGQAYMRLMRPLFIEKSCLKCHAAPGDKVGDIHGGLSVAVPMAPLWAAGSKHGLAVSLGHGLLWLVGLGGIVVGSLRVRRDVRERDRAEAATRRRNRELALLNRVIAAASATLEPEAVLELTCRELARAFDVPQAAAALLNEARTASTVVAEHLAEGRPPALGAVIPLEGNPATQYVLEHKAPLAVADAQHDPRMAPVHDLMRQRGTVSLLILPMVVRGQVVGTIGLDAVERREFSEEEITLAASAAAAAAQALENARLFAAEREARQLSDALSEIARELNAAPDLDTALDLVLSRMERVIALDSGSILLLEGGEMKVAAVRGFGEPERVLGLQFGLDVVLLNREVVETRQPLIAGAVADDPRWVRSVEAHGLSFDLAGVHSWMGVPLLIQDRVIGMLTADKVEPDFYRPQDAEIALAFAGHAATAIENARLFEATQQRVAELETVRQVSLTLTSSLELQAVLETILESTIKLSVQPRNVHIFLYQDGRLSSGLVLWADGRRQQPVIKPRPRGLTYAVVQQGEPIVVPDMRTHPLYADAPPDWEGAIVGLPLKIGQRVVGVMNVSYHQPRALPEAELRVLRLLADQAAIAIENARLYERAQEEIAERKRAEEQVLRQSAVLDAINEVFRETLACETDEEVARTCLAVAEELTGSKFGFIGEVNQAGRCDTIALSDPGWDACRMPRLDAVVMIEDMEIRGIWGRVLKDEQSQIVNDPAAHPDGVGTPEGHPPLTSFLGVPLKHAGRTIGMIGLANKESGYDLADQQDVEALSVAFVEALNRKRAEEALRESEEKYRTLFEESQDVVFITTPEGRFVDVSPAGVELFGYVSKEELLQADVARDLFVNPGDRETYRRVIERDGYVKDYELVLKRKDGREVIVLETTTAVHDDEGNVVVYRGIMRDVTEQRLLEQQFIRAQRMESIGTLAGGIAHDFNNLLGGILGYASLMKKRLTAEHPFFKHVEVIEQSSKRAAELTGQLLAFARGGKYQVGPVAVNEIVRETSRIIGETFDRAIEIEFHLGRDLPTVEGDAGQIQQVLMNVCVNARDAMPDGGELTIETEAVVLDEAYARIHLEAEARRYVVVSVTDTGVGMDEETMERIFEPFFTTKEVGEGTGLGLAMVYGVVKNHGGFVRVYSEPGEGSTFQVYLPAGGEAGEEAEELAEGEPPRGRGELVLVVDDEESIRDLAKDILEDYGYRVLLAENGVEAVEIYGQHKDDTGLVILDMIMPRMGGRETFLKLKEIDPEVRALLSTGFSQNEKAQAILDSGVMGFIQKPFEMDALLFKVRRILDSEV